MWINKLPCQSPMVYDSLQSLTKFKADMHNVYIREWKASEEKWATLPFITSDDVVFAVLHSWPPEWHAKDLATGDETTIQ